MEKKNNEKKLEGEGSKKIWIKSKKKNIGKAKYFHKQIVFANRYYFI